MITVKEKLEEALEGFDYALGVRDFAGTPTIRGRQALLDVLEHVERTGHMIGEELNFATERAERATLARKEAAL